MSKIVVRNTSEFGKPFICVCVYKASAIAMEEEGLRNVLKLLTTFRENLSEDTEFLRDDIDEFNDDREELVDDVKELNKNIQKQ